MQGLNVRHIVCKLKTRRTRAQIVPSGDKNALLRTIGEGRTHLGAFLRGVLNHFSPPFFESPAEQIHDRQDDQSEECGETESKNNGPG